MKFSTGAELGLVLALGVTLIVQANGAPPAALPAPAPTAEQIEAAVAFAEREAERINGPSR